MAPLATGPRTRAQGWVGPAFAAAMATATAGVTVMAAAAGGLVRASEEKPETSLRLLYGDGFDDGYYELNTANEGMTSLVGRHWRRWSRGDHYVWLGLYSGNFVDATTGSTQRGSFEAYAAWWPRLSLSKVSRKDLTWGPIADVYAVAELATGLGFDSASVGFSLDFKAPGFTYLGLAVYRRNDNWSGPAAQATVWWVRPCKAGRTTVTSEGYLYASGTDDVGTDFFSLIQVVTDLGVFMGQPANRFHAGIEWYYHDHRDQSVSVPQLILKWDW